MKKFIALIEGGAEFMTSNNEPETIEFYCQSCHSRVSAAIDSLEVRMKRCSSCLRKASASETLKRLKPINDPAISQMLRDYVYDD